MYLHVLIVFNSVQVLMSTVASVTGIPEDKQVLLISSGEALDPTERVCSYSSAGTVSHICMLKHQQIPYYLKSSLHFNFTNFEWHILRYFNISKFHGN